MAITSMGSVRVSFSFKSVLTRGSMCSTESSSGSSVHDCDDGCLETWMYWRREENCWTKVLAVLRYEYLWLTRGEGHATTTPLIQIAVKSVERSPLGGLHITDTVGEKLELFFYDPTDSETWMEALEDAALMTKAQLEEMEQHRSSTNRKTYSGTLAQYRKGQERETRKHDHHFCLHRLRRRWRRRVERMLDRWSEEDEHAVEEHAPRPTRPTLAQLAEACPRN
ncbi:TPA: hypothetical protein N0F65_012196 [Lagenidium giganteum]|uniref:PH domain-containing protein n=1 Tax=Lagenidium giganteum TaxID=4803 RepID=A0AAV2ZC72_9STRA|nr:TPA: hypothetical protein N0F65_012196 [Lagenidium giganteum]